MNGTTIGRTILVAVTALLTACAPQQEAPPSLEDAMDAADRPSDDGTTTDGGGDPVDTSEAGLDAEVRYGQAGGIAGRIEELRIAPDGTGELTSRGRDPVEFALDDAQLAELAAALERADLEDQPTDQMSDPAVPDAFTFELAQGDARVLTDEFAAPDELRPALELLRSIVEEHRPAR